MAPSFAELKAKAAKTTSSGVEKLQNMKDRNTSVSMKKTNWDPYSGKPPPPPPPPKSLINQRTKPELAPLPPPPSRTNSIASTSTASRSLSNSPGLAPPLPSRVSSTTRPPLPSRTPSTGPPLPKRPGQTAVSPPSRTGGLPKPASSGPPPPPPPVALSTKPVLNKRDSFYVEDEDPVIDWTNLSQQDKEVFFSWLDEFFSRYLQIDLAPRAIPYPTQPIGSVGGPPPLKASTKPTSWTPLTVGSSST
ncbi:hypothetical protein CC1G_15294 [Coprinopsis cinerea okayama7|uniref:Uncharacterized protein n=1 Tax=Coprinopsis cinerea (strain Okayama-7 / 130 / ATCC MYA-4618 / FGSC 9003) TaxID=240176 RepID=D6RPX3_COPC7|nr:hypothetical protein CC1G_15294 [Coprinopsis cinerea okayama7\|eukprot:XP_002910387.1 hypothetical protein CC1G_15294 [Coprinopsis cinerea okayama7\